ncbi:MAG: hypothetical protein ACM3SR_11720 [Ignavibacteriales bacterium]
MKDYKMYVISFQSSRKIPQNPTETNFNIPLKPAMRDKLQAIAEAEGTNPTCLGVLTMAHLINLKWDWEKGKPRSRGVS